MIAVQVNASSQVGAPPAGGCLAPCGGQATLLPAPEDVLGDPLMALMALQSRSQQLDVNSGIQGVVRNRQLRQKAWNEFQSAMKKAQKAKKKGGFWKKVSKFCGKLAKLATVVAAVAVAAGTGGAGAPASLALIGVAMSSASLLQSEGKFLQAMGMSEDLAGKLEVGLSVGSAVCSGGAAALGGVSSLNQADEAVQLVCKGAAATKGAASIADGVATMQSRRYEGEEADHLADALSQRLDEQRLQRMFYQILEQLEDIQDSDSRAMDSLRGAIDTRDATPYIIARRV